VNATQARMARAGMGIGLRVVAEKIGVTPNTISRLENGSDPKVSTVNVLRQFYEGNGISFGQDGETMMVSIAPAEQPALDLVEPAKAAAK